MNKIKVVDDNLESVHINNDISLEYFKSECPFGINEIKLKVNNSQDLNVEINLKEDTRLNLEVNLKECAKLNLNILTKGFKGKIQYKYNLLKDSCLNVVKFQNIDTIKEMIIVNLNGENSKINYNFKTISNNKETYDYHIFHKCNNTLSNIKNNGVCIENGLITYQVSSFVPKNIKGCTVTQNNRIINLTNNKCEIMPNLYIDSDDVEASHSALIGKFEDDKMFYIESRGLDYNSALKLLISGFLTSDIIDKKLLKEVNNNIEKYWG